MLDRVDLDKDLTTREYKKRLRKGQISLGELAWQVYLQKRSVIVVYEGWDAAGKGGNIRRFVEGLDPRGYKVHPIGKPEGEDAAHHYLWRFWRRVPPKGEIAIFDRSWYGRVLVERVEGFATPAEWRRAYGEINYFEQQLADAGAIIFKFWLHISPEVQMARFEERRKNDYKSWKLTEEDWRNRSKWAAYRRAVDEMLQRTSSITAPWTIVEASSKQYARVKTIETAVQELEKVFGEPKKKENKT